VPGQFGATQFGTTMSYPVDLYETEESIVLEMAVPGVRVEDLDISIEGRQLSTQGTLPEREGEGRRYWLQNIPHGQFSRTITLPVTVEVDNIEARVHDGLLVLTMPKVAEARARRIAISNG
jgi:HSP20 family protein